MDKDFCRQYPRPFRYLFESKRALNAGIQEAQRDVWFSQTTT